MLGLIDFNMAKVCWVSFGKALLKLRSQISFGKVLLKLRSQIKEYDGNDNILTKTRCYPVQIYPKLTILKIERPYNELLGNLRRI